MASQDARLSKFEADFKQQQCEMTNKIDIVLQAITDRIAGALHSNMVKNPKLNVNSTFPVLFARSYLTEDPQCSTQSTEEQWDTPRPELRKTTGIDKIRPNGDDEQIEWLDVKESMDLVDISDASVYESLIKEMPKCLMNYDFRIKKEIAFKTPYKDLEKSELSSEGHDLFSSRIILSEDDYDRGYMKSFDLEDRFYRDTIKLGPEYVTGIADEEEVTSLKVLRKCHLTILGGRFNQLSYVSSPLLSKSEEY
nr:ribonuclease H-like domain-containing protein [Tanacetum cinerariifolium]